MHIVEVRQPVRRQHSDVLRSALGAPADLPRLSSLDRSPQCRRCHCPLPWTGYRCNRILDCVQHDRLLGYDRLNDTQCELDLNATSLFPNMLACSCPIVGTFDVLGVEQAMNLADVTNLTAGNPTASPSAGVTLGGRKLSITRAHTPSRILQPWPAHGLPVPCQI